MSSQPSRPDLNGSLPSLHGAGEEDDSDRPPPPSDDGPLVLVYRAIRDLGGDVQAIHRSHELDRVQHRGDMEAVKVAFTGLRTDLAPVLASRSRRSVLKSAVAWLLGGLGSLGAAGLAIVKIYETIKGH